MASKKRIIMLVVTRDNIIMIAAPPRHPEDNYEGRAANFCTIPHIHRITIDWDGKVYIINDGDLYVGPMPCSKTMDWYAVAKKVAKKEFSRFNHIFFHPNGDLWGVTHDGRLFTGPPPTNQYLCWTFGKARLIGGGWNQFDAIFFDKTGTYLYAVNRDGKFYRGPTPTKGKVWTDEATTLGNGGWCYLTYIMRSDDDGNLWTVSRWNGDMFRGPMPTPEDNPEPYEKQKCQFLGTNYYRFPFICFTIDKTIESIFDFEFLPKQGKRMSETTEVLEEEIYDNRESSNVLKHTYTFTKEVTSTSSFTHDHGLTFAVGLEISFKAGVPGIGQAGTSVTMNTSTTHNWSFTKENETKNTLTSSRDVEIEPGHAIKMIASVKKVILEIPYKAKIRTIFGKEDCIEGIWKGATNYNVMVVQQDYNG